MPSSSTTALPRSNDQLNLTVLKRHEPSISTIVSIAPYAVLYTFSTESSQWEKSGIEGTLFLCGLYPSPTAPNRFAVLILNRRGLENFFMELDNSESVEITEEYVIVQSEDAAGQEEPEVYGLWIYQEEEGEKSTGNARSKNAGLIANCARIAGLSREMGVDVLASTDTVGAVENVGNGFEGKENGATGGGSTQTVQTAPDAINTQAKEQHTTAAAVTAPAMPQFQHSADTQFFLSAKRVGS